MYKNEFLGMYGISQQQIEVFKILKKTCSFELYQTFKKRLLGVISQFLSILSLNE